MSPSDDVPEPLQRALESDPVAAEAFATMPPSHRRRYADWVGEAKRPETQVRRVARALAMMRDWLEARRGGR
jgi:uncharacterized protein YdeI (YjbR/CyaY-like superfamily)